MKQGVWVGLAVAAVVAATGTTASSLTACGDSGGCTSVRSSTFAALQQWSACDPKSPEPCIKVFGNSKDCSGVLTCDFAVNPAHRLEAEQRVLTIAGDSQGCYLCATPNCVNGDIAICDFATRQCILITDFVGGSGDGGAEGGTSGFTQGDMPPPDSGTPATTPDTGAAPVTDASDFPDVF
ncbi:MAG TPA: hypothetical protein VHV30_01470 [Polyangiaceae bacterium]|nr:hypothetical protein [Polyangiaceae bacterium]